MADEKRRWRSEPATYYDQPALKAAHWDWRVSSYIFVAGLAGGAQMLATMAGEAGSVRRNGRYLGFLGSLVCAPLLIWDLKTPKRFYNMLRIFRASSPMSFGSYILTGFGLFSGLTAFGQFLGARGLALGGRLAALLQWPAAAFGAGMSCYTGALLSSTSTPLWAAAPRLLAARLAASSIAAGAAALSLGEQCAGEEGRLRRRGLDRIACLASGVGLGLSLLLERRWRQRGVASAVESGQAAQLERGALVLGHVVPLACYAAQRLSSRHSETLSVVGGLSILVGGYLTREALLQGGADSTRRPRDYFRFARSEREHG
ncbi:NrfD/PsrC family molybdoenzyme membrane anchor subunit [Aquibaculum sediminis]|uniref:NrfD/PsrC family molybdoenzyme membrane anchor subunit n=1 Tax=Aquibaculum sediminis TaxID=3231907 RepID=UPI0034513B01